MPARPSMDAAALRHARSLLARHPVIDGHNDLPWTIRNDPKARGNEAAYDLRRPTRGDTDLARLKAGGVGGQFWSVYIPGDLPGGRFARTQLEQIDIARRVIARYPERLAPALTAADVERAQRRGRIASLLGIEGGHAIEGSLGALRAYYDLGVRYMTLTHNVTLDWADSCNDVRRHGGLTAFGKDVVREMNRLGMLVDLAHTSPEVMGHALDVSAAPLISSHSSCRALTDVTRNFPDAILRRLPRNGGVIMITFVGPVRVAGGGRRLQGDEGRAPATAPGGPTHRQRGARSRRRTSASIPCPRRRSRTWRITSSTRGRWPAWTTSGSGATTTATTSGRSGWRTCRAIPLLFAELIRRGWSDRDLAKLARGNILRVMREAEAVAARLSRRGRGRPPASGRPGKAGHDGVVDVSPMQDGQDPDLLACDLEDDPIVTHP